MTLYKGGRLKASIRYMYYRMFQEGASENGANNTILAVAEGLGVKLPTCLPARRTKHKLRLEAGVWATFCAIRKMCAAKQDATRRGVPFSISKGRDGTTKQGWHFQVLTLTFRVGFDDPVSVVMAISLAHDKKAVTQATLTGTVVRNIVALSGGVLHEDDFKSSVVTDSANNEKKTNRLEGNKVHVPCLAHISSNTGKHGVKDQHVSCLCGQWDPPGGVGPTDSVQCESCLVWVHMSCYSLTHDSLPPSFQCVVCQLDSVPCVGGTENWEYHEGKLRELVKAFLDGLYGKGAAAEFRGWMAERGVNEVVLGRNVGARFFGVFFVCAQVLVKHDLLVEFSKTKPQLNEKHEETWWSGILKWLTSTPALVFLKLGTVLHATWGKVFFTSVSKQKLSVAQANPFVHTTSDLLMKYATDPSPCMALGGRGMSLVRASPLVRLVKARMRTVFAVMQKQWAKYTVHYLPGGPLNLTTSSSPHLLHTSPATTIFEESVFGTLSAAFRALGVRASPLGAVATTVSKMNRHITQPLTESDVPFVLSQVSNASSKNELRTELADSRKAADTKVAADKARATAEKENRVRAREEREHEQAAKRQRRAESAREKAKQPRQPRKREREPHTSAEWPPVQRTTTRGRTSQVPARYLR